MMATEFAKVGIPVIAGRTFHLCHQTEHDLVS